MLYIIKVIYGFLMPPGIFIILFLFMSIFFYRHKKRLASWLLFITVSLYLLSIPVTGDLLIHSLESDYDPPSSLDGDVIIMLGAGATRGTADIDGNGQLSGDAANRLLTVARLYKKTELPIIVSGGSVFKDSGNEAEIAKRQLIGLGIPENKIYIENKSLNTTQNAKFTKVILKANHFQKPILVTSAYHMKRSMQNFSKIGVNPTPFPTDYKTSAELRVYVSKFVPSDFGHVRIALKEYLGQLAISIKN
ncbi:YdcF family protein [Bacillus sp. 03113]|uniref:YdcF family protein n=1 Tax=Bacillus sp. 03113 TaxID=2578211 RepID=UPI001142A2F9|nr:YdcF family protein [Bacillus sp. 03113]